MGRKLAARLLGAALTCCLLGSAMPLYAEEGVEIAVDAAEGAAVEGTVPEEAVPFDGDIRIWMPPAVQEVTQQRIALFQEQYPDYAVYNIQVEGVSEEETAGLMLSNIAGGADLYAFSQDMLGILVSGGALTPLDESASWIREQNDESSVYAATQGDVIYAFPMTSDNGCLLYYDRSVLKDVSTVEGILADIEPLGKKFYMELTSGFYQPAFFFATGCDLMYETDAAGNFTDALVSCASDYGLAALKGMISVASSPSFANGSSIADAANCAAIVGGSWDSAAAREYFGENFACAKLPTFSVGDMDYQMSGFGGFKLLGIRPQANPDKLAVIRLLAQFLTGEAAQTERYAAGGWGPSNRAAWNSEPLLQDETANALVLQLQYSLPLRQYPSGYWSVSASLGENIVGGALNDATDEELMAILEEYENTCLSLAG